MSLRGAVSDLAETLRRLFGGTPVHSCDPRLKGPRALGMPPLGVRTGTAELSPHPLLATAALVIPAPLGPDPLPFPAHLQKEEGWTQWAAGVGVKAVEPLASAVRRTEVPALPARAESRRLEGTGWRCSARFLRDPIRVPGVRQEHPRTAVPRVFRDLETAFRVPLGVVGEDPRSLPKALWMRYTLQMVRETGENVRGLEILGLYRVPARGVRGLRHDGKSGKLLLDLDPTASGAPRVPLLLARRISDRTLVSCFLEEIG